MDVPRTINAIHSIGQREGWVGSVPYYAAGVSSGGSFITAWLSLRSESDVSFFGAVALYVAAGPEEVSNVWGNC